MDSEQVRRARLRANLLAGAARNDGQPVAGIVKAVCAIQAQEMPAAALAVRARSSGLTAADVDRARLVDRTVVRAWCLRGTLHLIAAEDFGWLIGLLGADQLAGSRRRLAQMGLDSDSVERAISEIRKLLGDRGPLNRAEVAAQLERRSGIVAEGQARIHLIYQLAMRGEVCQGPDRDGEPAYLLVEDWIGKQKRLPRAQALADLALRYARAYGPSDPQGLAAWSGLSLSAAREGWELIGHRLAEVEFDGGRLWLLRSQEEWLADGAAPPAEVSLLPRYDAYLLGYANRDLQVATEYARRVNGGGGIIHPVLLVDGVARGLWHTRQRARRIEVVVEPFEPLPADLRPRIEAEAADVGRFLNQDAVLTGL